MSIFEYSSILLAVVLGHSIVLLFDKVTYAITKKNGLRLYWFELLLAFNLLNMQLFCFFSVFNQASNLTEIGYLNFLGPFVVFFTGYLVTYFFPLPKSSLNIIDIGAYFWERIGAWITWAGFAVLLAPMGIVQLTEDYNDLLDFSRGYPQLMKILYLSYPVLVFIFFSSMANISN